MTSPNQNNTSSASPTVLRCFLPLRFNENFSKSLRNLYYFYV
jgi:hypothetical protein